MKPFGDLQRILHDLDGRGYKAYRAITGSFEADRFVLVVDRVQADPYAFPSRVRVLIPPDSVRLPDWSLASSHRRVAAADFLNRTFHRSVGGYYSRRGSGKSGEIRVLRPGQEVLARTSLAIREDGSVEVRFYVGLPAAGRRILGHAAANLFRDDVTGAIDEGLLPESREDDALRRHVESVEDARAIRERLDDLGLVAFLADGAVLPRRSGIDDHPLAESAACPFASPESLRVHIDTPNGGRVTGMGIPRGVTLIVGGGYHGKSTLLRAIERGVYDHVPGDGRELVVSVGDAVKIRAEDGRHIAGVDISNFIDGLPAEQSTERFVTDNASGSTSQAAAIVEALEVGACCLLLDEDTSATNFMIRDARMQELVASGDEPITPFIDRARQLFEELGVSTVLVVGGAGDYFDVADTVIAMKSYVPNETTEEARRIAARYPTSRRQEGGDWNPVRPRVPLPRSLDPSRGRRDVSIKAQREDRVLFGTEEVDLAAVEQVVEVAQVRAMARAVAWGRKGAIDGANTMPRALGAILHRIDHEGLEILQTQPEGDLAAFRIHELAAFLNRIRSLEVASD